MACKIASGVAGADKKGLTLIPFCKIGVVILADTASRSAENTDNANIKGGSPTAFERWIVFSRFWLSYKFTLKIFGISVAVGIL